MGKTSNADAYDLFLTTCRAEIAIALLGQNMSTEATSNRASSATGFEVTRDIRDGHAAVVAALMNRIIGLIVERAIYFLGRGHLNAKAFLEQLRKLLSANNVDRAKKLCDATTAPAFSTSRAGPR